MCGAQHKMVDIWYILHRHQSPLQNFVIMHAFIVQNIQRKRIAAEPASGAESLMHQTFRFAPWKSIRFVLERLNFTFRFRPKIWSRTAKRIDFADFSPSGIPLVEYNKFINGIYQFYEWNITLLCTIYNNNIIWVYHIYQWYITFFWVEYNKFMYDIYPWYNTNIPYLLVAYNIFLSGI